MRDYLLCVGIIAPSYTAVASRAFGTSRTPVIAPQQPMSFMERAKGAAVGSAKAVANAVMDPVKTGSKAVAAVKNNPGKAIAVATVVAGLIGGHYFGLDSIAAKYATDKGSELYNGAGNLAQDWVGTPVAKGKNWVVGTVGGATMLSVAAFGRTAHQSQRQRVHFLGRRSLKIS